MREPVSVSEWESARGLQSAQECAASHSVTRSEKPSVAGVASLSDVAYDAASAWVRHSVSEFRRRFRCTASASAWGSESEAARSRVLR